MAFRDGLVVAGAVVRVQGLRGEVRVQPRSGDPSVLTQVPRVRVGETWFEVRSARSHRGQAVLKLAGVDSIDTAQALVGAEVTLQRADFPPPAKGVYYWFDLVGCDVFGVGGEKMGTVESMATTSAHDQLVIRREDGREVWMPFVAAFLHTVDVAQGRIVADPPPGLFD